MYRNHVIHSWQKRGEERKRFGCLHPRGLLVMSSRIDDLESAVDVLDKQKADAVGGDVLNGLLPPEPDRVFLFAVSLKAIEHLNPRVQMIQHAYQG
jgi:hypothetical protein